MVIFGYKRSQMKSNLTLVSSLFLLQGTLTAQTLTQANSAPVPGDAYTVQRGSYVEQGPPGTAQTWDHSDLVSLGATSFAYVTPASTGVSSSFPGSTVALPIPGVPGSYVFYNSASTGLFQLGARQTGTTLFYNNAETLFPFPCSYGTTWTDEFGSNYTSGGQSAVRTGTITGEADGTGTLILPFGTIQNVIRIHVVENSEDVLSSVPYFTYASDHYVYYKPGFHGPIFGIYQTTSATFGTPSEVNYTQWVDGADVSVQDLLNNSIGIDVFPVPATDELNVLFSSQGGAVDLQVMDAQGRIVHHETRAASLGVDRQVLDVHALSSGVYHLRITARNGDQGLRRFVVE